MHVQEGRGVKTGVAENLHRVSRMPSYPANRRVHISLSPLLHPSIHISFCNYRCGQDLFHCFKKEMHPSPYASCVCCLSGAYSIHPSRSVQCGGNSQQP